MKHASFITLALFFSALGACSSSDTQSTTGSPTMSSSSSGEGGGGTGGAGTGGAGTGGAAATGDLALLDTYLRGDFDNSAQKKAGFDKLVERHVCPIPGRDTDPNVLWLYVEQVEVSDTGVRDAYFTRVNEIKMVNGKPVSRAYRFDPSSPLYTNPQRTDNGTRDGCKKPELLKEITDKVLDYRDGCDVTFTKGGNVFSAATEENTCSFPGGFINTKAEVTADGLDATDSISDGKQSTPLATFKFRRIKE